MQLSNLSLRDFRCYRELDVDFAPGATVVRGSNGQGKTSLLEAVAWVATARSFRGVPDATLVRSGAERAVVRAACRHAGRDVTVEAEIPVTGRNRVFVNRQSLPRRRELADALRVTVFAPDDLDLVKGGPASRRNYLDNLLVASATRYDAARSDFERILRNRNALLRRGSHAPDTENTLAVFDEQLARAGGELVRGRVRLGARLAPLVAAAYGDLAAEAAAVSATYEAEWAEGRVDVDRIDEVETRLHDALSGRRREELERGVTLVGPHRDEWRLRLHGGDARTHASQGEQRTLALALRLGGHQVIAELIGEDPVLLLDDVFSELDMQRAEALVDRLPGSQTLVTSAGALPAGVRPERWLRVVDGRVERDETGRGGRP